MVTVPGVGREQADGEADRGALAGAVGAEQAEHFALANRERKPVDGDDLAEGLPDVRRGSAWIPDYTGASGSAVRQPRSNGGFSGSSGLT